MNVQIKRWSDGQVIYAGEFADVRSAIERAVKEKSYLSRANLSGAYLSGASGILQIGPIGSRKAVIYVVSHNTGPMIQAGCFWGTLSEFAQAVKTTHGDDDDGLAYRAAITFIRAYCRAYRWPLNWCATGDPTKESSQSMTRLQQLRETNEQLATQLDELRTVIDEEPTNEAQ